MPKTVLVTFYSNKRIIEFYPNGELTVAALREKFFKTFEDVIPEGITPDKILFQRFSKKHGDWINLTDEDRVKNKDKIRAELKQSQISPPHPIKPTKAYRLWNPSSRANESLLKLTTNPCTLKCDGHYSDPPAGLKIQFMDESTPSTKLYRLQFEGSNDTNKWLITGVGEHKDVIVQPFDTSTGTVQENQKFEPFYFYGSTRFRCFNVGGRNDLFLSVESDGKVTLAQGGPIEYPVASSLFGTNEQP
ncbi:uncharacterized protein LOC116603737 [Nematostella vectensis]|uniref:uncharacterized protein LOC116603737 n=1 Tax=Nematostella vectensis TaxID=45351 RepID=UPI0020777B85|nr:uncharacterized protein LOC116603737 [Nematostella vectensis]